MQGGYKNDMLGIVFDPLFGGEQKLTGEYVLEHMFGISLDHSKWWDLFALYVLIIVYRIVFLVILKLKERAAPFFSSLHAKRTIYRLKKHPSFQRLPSHASRRHHNLRSLCSQEGLSSPIPQSRGSDKALHNYQTLFQHRCSSFKHFMVSVEEIEYIIECKQQKKKSFQFIFYETNTCTQFDAFICSFD